LGGRTIDAPLEGGAVPAKTCIKWDMTTVQGNPYISSSHELME